jgi:ribosomal-protein-alanine N-acetyltransferase
MSAPLPKLPETIRTARLLLRRPRLDDAPAIFRNWASVPVATRYLSWPTHQSVAETETHVATTVEWWERGSHVWLITMPPSDEPIGSIGARVREGDADLGYVLSPDHWGQGIVPEAGRAIIAELFAQPAISSVWAHLDAENQSSERTVQKLGMTLVERFTGPVVHPNVSDEPRPCLKYAVSRAEWEAWLPSHPPSAID